MMATSDYAPAGWRMDETEAAIRGLVLEHDPDVVLFQELPGMVPYIETHDMVPANAKGQTGDIATLVRRELMDGLVAETQAGAVLARVAGVTLANVHLESGSGGTDARLGTLSALCKAVDGPLVVIGDTNTRVAEEEAIEALGLIGPRPPAPTWNGRICRYRKGAREFTAYYSRAFGRDVMLEIETVVSTPLGARGERFHLSDHFAFTGKIGPAAA